MGANVKSEAWTRNGAPPPLPFPQTRTTPRLPHVGSYTFGKTSQNCLGADWGTRALHRDTPQTIQSVVDAHSDGYPDTAQTLYSNMFVFCLVTEVGFDLLFCFPLAYPPAHTSQFPLQDCPTIRSQLVEVRELEIVKLDISMVGEMCTGNC